MAVAQSSFINKGLLKTTSCRDPLLDLKQVGDYTKFKGLYVSFR